MKISRTTVLLLASLVLASALLSGCSDAQKDRLRDAGQSIGEGAREIGGVLAEFTAEKREQMAEQLDAGRDALAERKEELMRQIEEAEGPAREAAQEKLEELEILREQLPELMEQLRGSGAENLEALRERTGRSLERLGELVGGK